jgi:formyltetrahydrofolate synthetase
LERGLTPLWPPYPVQAGPIEYRFLYPPETSIKEKLATIVREMYGGDGVEYTPEAEEKIAAYTAAG